MIPWHDICATNLPLLSEHIRVMATSPAASDASHESDDAQNHGSSKNQQAVKDKECQYCHQKFTSSSLGRHLDQFISKKKPDGIHNVEEIKKIRAGITRRTARGGKRNESIDQTDSHDQSGPTSPRSSNNITTPAFLENPNKATGTTNGVGFNRMGWQATGVITDPMPQSANTNSIPSPLTITTNNANIAAGAKRSFSTYAADLPTSSSTAINETTRALELSLREVLDAVNSATKRTAPLPQAFPFELTAQTFPALCLLLLPTPATLFQPSPFSTAATIPLKPPGPEQLQALRTIIRVTLDQWKWDALAHVQRTASSQTSSTNVAEEAERLSQTSARQTEEALRHLETAFQWFMSVSPEQQYSLWSVELLRAFKSEQDKLKEAKDQIARVSQEASQLQQQIDYLSRCQWPREMALWPPERNTFSSAVQKELQKNDPAAGTSLAKVNSYGTPSVSQTLGGLGEERWDFEKIVNKWKRHVREDRARRGGAGNMLPPLADHHGGESGTPPTTLRKSNSDTSGLHNGLMHNTNPIIDSPTVRNGVYNFGLNDKMTTFANATNNTNPNPNAGPGGNSHRQFAGTPSSLSNANTSHAHTPVTNNVQIISDVHDHMARFAPWFREKELAEEAERLRDASDD